MLQCKLTQEHCLTVHFHKLVADWLILDDRQLWLIKLVEGRS